jgi:glycosyltransferase involved in cell wall biosynthesis
MKADSSRQMLVTVVVSTFNPNKHHFSRTLQALAAQSLPATAWELILVDNNSDCPLALNYPVEWHPNVRWLHEPEQGKISAMRRGFGSATADLIITVDDDNILSPGYLETALSIAGKHPDLGAFGAGRTEAEYEIEPPSWFHLVSGFLALRQVDQVMIGGGNKPWGLGLCITRTVAQAWLHWCASKLTQYPSLKGRKATTLEDTLFSFCAVQNGLDYGIFPELKLIHQISSSRLEISYLSALAYDQGYSHAYFAIIIGESLSNPIREGSAKAAGMLLLQGRPKLAREEFRRFIVHSRQPDEVTALRLCLAIGWDHALEAYQNQQKNL